jgi:hypothetical protein
MNEYMLQEINLLDTNNARLEGCHVALVTGRLSEEDLADIYRNMARSLNVDGLDDVNRYGKHAEK